MFCIRSLKCGGALPEKKEVPYLKDAMFLSQIDIAEWTMQFLTSSFEEKYFDLSEILNLILR